jgi:hypothetical protein
VSRKKQPDLPMMERFVVTTMLCDGGARGRRYTPPGPPAADRPLIVIDEAGVPREMLTGGALGEPVGPPVPPLPYEHLPGCHHPPAPVPNARPTPPETDPPVTSDRAVSLEPPREGAGPPPTPAPKVVTPRPKVRTTDVEPEHVFEPELDAFWTES